MSLQANPAMEAHESPSAGTTDVGPAVARGGAARDRSSPLGPESAAGSGVQGCLDRARDSERRTSLLLSITGTQGPSFGQAPPARGEDG